jgi:hypothetical protein
MDRFGADQGCVSQHRTVPNADAEDASAVKVPVEANFTVRLYNKVRQGNLGRYRSDDR